MIESNDDPISISFIDCISCGLAAATFMFILFAALPRMSALASLEGAGALGESTIGKQMGQTSVPLEIEISLTPPLPVEKATWSSAPSKGDRSYFETVAGTASTFRQGWSAVDAPKDAAAIPSFVIQRDGIGSTGISGRVRILSGSEYLTFSFFCPATSTGGQSTIVSFSSDGSPVSDCYP